MPESDYTPTVDDIGALLPLRTFYDSAEVGTFNTNTRPTATQVTALIQAAADELEAAFGPDVVAQLQPAAKQIVKYRTAMMIELGFFADQIQAGRSSYPELLDLYTQARKDFLAEAANIAPDGDGLTGAGLPAYSFPPLRPEGLRAPGAEWPFGPFNPLDPWGGIGWPYGGCEE